MTEWTLKDMIEAVGWTTAKYAQATGQHFCTARGQIYEGRVPAYPKPDRIKRVLATANKAAGMPVPPEAIKALWMLRRSAA